MGGSPPVTDPVIRAATGDKQAWDTLVERYAPLVWSIRRRHRLGDAGIARRPAASEAREGDEAGAARAEGIAGGRGARVPVEGPGQG
jgi:hypothetical protein